MIYLKKEILINTLSIDIAVAIVSGLSLICSIITIIIYLRIKSLRTIIYRLFFQIAINETISRIITILIFFIIYVPVKITTILELELGNRIVFFITAFLKYFTDLNIQIFLTLTCYSMFELIIQQNKGINKKLTMILVISYILSFIITAVFFILPLFALNEYDNTLDETFNKNKSTNKLIIEIYRNVINLVFVKDKDRAGRCLASLIMTTSIFSLLILYTFYKIIRIQVFIKKRRDLNELEEDENSQDRRTHNSLKLTSFTNKMWEYPLLGFIYFLPLCAYSWLEQYKPINSNGNDSDANARALFFLRIRFCFYNILCFINCIRGWMYFKVFISNEKIKLFLFKNFLTSSVFHTIDKIKDISKRSTSIFSEISNDNNNNEINKYGINSEDDEDDSLVNNSNTFSNGDSVHILGEINDDEDEDMDSRSQKIKAKKAKKK